MIIGAVYAFFFSKYKKYSKQNRDVKSCNVKKPQISTNTFILIYTYQVLFKY